MTNEVYRSPGKNGEKFEMENTSYKETRIIVIALAFVITLITLAIFFGSCGPDLIKSIKDPKGSIEPEDPKKPCISSILIDGKCNHEDQLIQTVYVRGEEKLFCICKDAMIVDAGKTDSSIDSDQ